jgi:predicted RNase H-like nuclease (RuvC/YqgF family)
VTTPIDGGSKMTVRKTDIDRLVAANEKMREELAKIVPQIDLLVVHDYESKQNVRKFNCKYSSGVENTAKYEATLKVKYLQDANESFLGAKVELKELTSRDIQGQIRKEIREKETEIENKKKAIEDKTKEITALKESLEKNERIIKLKLPKDFFKKVPDPMDNDC